ncbi:MULTISPECIES: OmpW/AlkL family protein [Thalassospira]|uniref:OmpW family protein n=2 Tax=Thalassospira TaxID=168934 RepID=A0A8I1M5G1_9PROT|nr:OmpW family outer membrane protein [Thalassospira povalilytica]MBN8195496.1 OmpW family protein [Thalassospira povalilytica]MCC4239695.1 outer membrane beta-barrel protein [Thalassospira povalilytica]MEE3047501.1 OmpW family outer membrane protein [Pseudomonadota bacterium]HAY48524.1 OmpW family protein [Thalassospira sp.]|tara:strand:+ start:1460 stop:2119 length:660 start_codon:yes stop_codon:yes gene_type:complete
MSFLKKTMGATALGGLMAAALLSGNVAYAQTAEFKPKQAGDFLIRGRVLGVVPDEDVTSSSLGGEGEIDNDVIPELDFSYFITDNIALELIAGTSQHDVTWDTGSSNLDLGSVRLLPPTLTAQYHFMPDSRWSPYIGAGINYTFFYDSKPGQFNSVKYDDGFGYAFQAGFDYAISGPWSLNVDVKKIYLNTDVSVNNGAVKADADIDPWLFGIGVGYRF